MEKNAPLKELIKIAEINYSLAIKIADDFPSSELDYDLLIDTFLSASQKLKHLVETLIKKIETPRLDIEKLFLQFKDSSNYEVKGIAAKLLAKHFSDKLGLHTMLDICELSTSAKAILAPILINTYIGELTSVRLFNLFAMDLPSELANKVKSTILALPKEKLDPNILKTVSSENYGMVSDIASIILLDKFQNELDAVSLVHMLKSSDEVVKARAWSTIETMPKEKIKYQDLINLQESSDEDVREAAATVSDLIPAKELSVDALIEHIDNPDKDIRRLAHRLLLRIPKEMLPFEQLSFLVRNGNRKQCELASQLLVSHFGERMPYELLKQIYTSSSNDEIYEPVALLILNKFGAVVEPEILEKMKNIKNLEVRNLSRKLLKANDEKFNNEVAQFFEKHNLKNGA